MSDLVERLRGRADRYRQLCGNAAYYTEGDALFDEKAADRIEKLEAALRAVMDDLTLIGKNHWLPVGLLDDVIYVNALAVLYDDHSIGHKGGLCTRERT